MPMPNEHSARLVDPGKFKPDSFRRINDKFGKGIHAIFGRLKGETTMTLQAIRFDKAKFTAVEAKKWLADNDYKPVSFEAAAEEKGEGGLFRRAFEINLTKEQPSEDNRVRVVASTDTPFEMWDWSETLLHGKENVELLARSLLLSHDRLQVAGGVASAELDGHRCVMDVEIDKAATFPTGLNVLEGVRKGYVRGISIGYNYRPRDCDVKHLPDGKRELTVKKWQLREVSLTPTPVDPNAMVVRSFPAGIREEEDDAMTQEEKEREAEAAKLKAAAEEKEREKKAAEAKGLVESEERRAVELVRAIREMAPKLLKPEVVEAIALDPKIKTLDEAKALLLKALAEATKPAGTPEPTQTKQDPKPAPTPDEIGRAFSQ